MFSIVGTRMEVTVDDLCRIGPRSVEIAVVILVAETSSAIREDDLPIFYPMPRQVLSVSLRSPARIVLLERMLHLHINKDP